MIRAIEVHRSKFPDIRDDRLDAESAYSEDSLDTFYGTDRCVFSVFEVVDVCRRKAQFVGKLSSIHNSLSCRLSPNAPLIGRIRDSPTNS
jgi:hypothetical protein